MADSVDFAILYKNLHGN